MEVKFFKDYFSTTVHLYQDGRDKKYMQMPQYQGRTELVKDFMSNGRVFLQLKKVTATDTGLYGCWFRSKTHEQEAVWDLQVTGSGSAPLISVMGYVGGGIQLLCQSSGWVSQPIVRWIGPDERELLSDSKVIEDAQGLFDVETSLIVQKDSGNISCSVQHISHSGEVKSRILIDSTFFRTSSWLPVSIVLILFCTSGWVWIVVASFSFFKSHDELQDKLDREKIQICKELEKTQEYAEKLTLDPDTAHPQLYISDTTTVTYKAIPQEVAELDKRFAATCLVTCQGFLSGKHYWEVNVGHNKSWYLGVCRDSVDRKKLHVNLSPMNGYWVLGLETEDLYFVNNPNRIRLYPRSNLTKVGIFLDYECGTLSFFNADDPSLIYTLTCRFEGLLRPYIQFNPHNVEKVTPIIIVPATHRISPPCPVPSDPATRETGTCPHVSIPLNSLEFPEVSPISQPLLGTDDPLLDPCASSEATCSSETNDSDLRSHKGPGMPCQMVGVEGCSMEDESLSVGL
ncbi:butyrophilin-like protein 3 [Thomomys bottae]